MMEHILFVAQLAAAGLLGCLAALAIRERLRRRPELPAATRRAIRRGRAAARLELPYLYTDDPRDEAEDTAPPCQAKDAPP